MTPSFEKIECSLRAILADLSGALSSAEQAEIDHFIDVGEYGVALETLAALLVEERKPLALPTFERIVALAEGMGLEETIPAALRDRVETR